MKDMSIASEKMLGYKHEDARLQAWGCAEQSFYDVTKTQYDWISHNRVSREQHVEKKGL